jgi:integrase/recombinase XerD
MKITSACEEFLSHCRVGKNLSEHTLRAYNIDLNEFSAFCTQTTAIADCDRHILLNYLTYLFDKKNLKETSIKRRMACLKAMFHWLESEELLANILFTNSPSFPRAASYYVDILCISAH